MACAQRNLLNSHRMAGPTEEKLLDQRARIADRWFSAKLLILGHSIGERQMVCSC